MPNEVKDYRELPNADVPSKVMARVASAVHGLPFAIKHNPYEEDGSEIPWILFIELEFSPVHIEMPFGKYDCEKLIGTYDSFRMWCEQRAEPAIVALEKNVISYLSKDYICSRQSRVLTFCRSWASASEIFRAGMLEGNA